jgi:hypothetical protein
MNDNITVVATTTCTVPRLRSGVNGSPGGEVRKFILGHVGGAAQEQAGGTRRDGHTEQIDFKAAIWFNIIYFNLAWRMP